MLKKGSLITLVLILILTSVIPSFALNVTDEDLDRELEQYIDIRREATAGVALAVIRDGEVLNEKLVGYIDVENQLPVDENSVFEWGSVTKVLTWVSVMQLVEDGKLDLQADIRNYLPEGFLTKLRYEEPITLLHLMNHQAGFQEVLFDSEFLDESDVSTLKESLQRSEPPQIYEPGTVTAYSNYGAALAGYIVESVSGMPFYEYVRQNIFEPLEMHHTAIKPGWSDQPWVKEKRMLSKSYAYYEDQKDSYGLSMIHIALYPAGSAAGTFPDYVRFVSELTKKESKLFKHPETLDMFLSPSLNYQDSQESRVHHGLWSVDYGEKMIGHGGNTRGFSSAFWLHPQDQSAVAVMSNEVGEMTYNYGILELLYGQEQLKVVPGEDISGLYYSKRSFQEGPGRIATYASALLPIKKTNQPGVFEVAMLGFDIISLGEGVYRQDSGNGFAVDLYKISGEDILQSYTMDYEKMSWAEIILSVVLILGSVIVFPLALICLVIHLVRKIRKKKISTNWMNRLALVAAMGISGIFFYLWMFIEEYRSTHVQMVCLILMALMAFVTVNVVVQILRVRKKSWKSLVFSIVLFLPVLNCLFFETYKFWV